MDIVVQHNEGEDFGQVYVGIGRDDTATVEIDGTTGTTLSFALYQHEAAELIEKLRAIAESDPLL